jgi:hypothetical protein
MNSTYITIEAILADEPVESCKRHRAQDVVDKHLDEDMVCHVYYDTQPRFLAGWINLIYHSTVELTHASKVMIILAGLKSDSVCAREAAIDAAVEWGLLDMIDVDKEPVQWLNDYIRKVKDEVHSYSSSDNHVWI